MTMLADQDYAYDTNVACSIATNTPKETVVEIPLDVLAHLIACAEDQRLTDLEDRADDGEPRFDHNQSHALDVAWVWFAGQNPGDDSINAVCRYLTHADPAAVQNLKATFDRIGVTRP